MNIKALDEIQKIYTDVSEWLKFIEAKHAGMFAAWVALLIAITTSDFFSSISMELKVILIVIHIIGIAINTLALSPFSNRINCLREKCYNKYKKSSSHNVIFYQDIFVKTYSMERNIIDSLDKYKELLEEKGLHDLDNKLVQDYMRQVIEVATVGTIKVYLFSIATKYVYLIMSILIIALIIA